MHIFKRTFATTSPSSSATNKINIGVLLCRKQQKQPTAYASEGDFESAYLQFKEKELLNEKRDFKKSIPFYYKKGSLAEQRFWDAQKEAEKEDAGINEIVQPTEPDIVDWYKSQVAIESDMSKFDADLKSLDRAPTKSIFYFVRDKKTGRLVLPESPLEGSLGLHEAAPKMLSKVIGKKNDVWFVGKIPIGHFKDTHSSRTTFIMKANIFAGKIEGGREHAWLSKEECKEKLDPYYYAKIQDILL